jgi:hypothetical protein
MQLGNCFNGMWRKFLAEFMHDFTGLEPVKNIVEDKLYAIFTVIRRLQAGGTGGIG